MASHWICDYGHVYHSACAGSKDGLEEYELRPGDEGRKCPSCRQPLAGGWLVPYRALGRWKALTLPSKEKAEEFLDLCEARGSPTLGAYPVGPVMTLGEVVSLLELMGERAPCSS